MPHPSTNSTPICCKSTGCLTRSTSAKSKSSACKHGCPTRPSSDSRLLSGSYKNSWKRHSSISWSSGRCCASRRTSWGGCWRGWAAGRGMRGRESLGWLGACSIGSSRSWWAGGLRGFRGSCVGSGASCSTSKPSGRKGIIKLCWKWSRRMMRLRVGRCMLVNLRGMLSNKKQLYNNSRRYRQVYWTLTYNINLHYICLEVR